jgi:hypothetical protein
MTRFRNFIAAFLLIQLLPLACFAQEQFLSNGSWRSYLSYRASSWSVSQGEQIFTITRGGISVFDRSDNSLRTLSTVNGFSGIEPTSIYKATATGQIFVGYSDGTINYFLNLEDIGTISDIKRNTTFTSKDIRGFSSNNNRLFVATDFGLQVFDLNTLKPLFTVSKIGSNTASKVPVLSVTVTDQRVWVAMDSRGLFSANVNSPNFTDPSSWRMETGQNGLPEENILNVVSLGDDIYVHLKENVYTLQDGQWSIHPRLDRQFTYLDVQEGYLSAGRLSYFISFQENDQNVREVFNVEAGNVAHALIFQDKAYIADVFDGIREYDYSERSYNKITPGGPSNNQSFRVAAGNGELYIAPGGHDASGVPADPGPGIFYYNHRSGTWKTLNGNNGELPSDRANNRFARAFYDPASGTAYLGSWGSGLAVLKDGELIDAFTCENSELNYILATTCNPVNATETRISGMGLDQSGNLWVSLSQGQRPLVVRKTDGSWHSYSGSRFPGSNFFGLIVDDFGSKWMLSRLSGLYVFNENSTIENEQDDAVITLRSGPGQGDLQADGVRSLAKDQDGFIWVGTEKGITVFYDAFSIGQGQRVDGACPAFERRCLLREEQINAIQVDGGNRKWVGTNNGVFLISDAGDEVFQQFTTENSPLISDLIYDIAIDGSTGEVYFATDKGVIAYQGDATAPRPECNDLIVYPNPVIPDYQGVITVKGTAANSRVRITSISGMLVKEIEAQGATAIWDGTDVYGNRVSAGIYLAIASNEEGEQGCIGKFTVLR